MNRTGCRLATGAAAAMLFACAALAQDVPYVPTPNNVVEAMLSMALVGPGDYVIDLGCGDGRILVTAAKKYDARGFGVDINPVRIEESNANARKAGVTDRVAFRNQDLFKTDIADASVLTMYLLPRVNLALRPKILAELKPGTRVVSHDFDMGEWEPDQTRTLNAPEKYGGAGGTSTVYLWIVPARAAGKWHWQIGAGGATHDYELELVQQFQKIGGNAKVDGRAAAVSEARLRGSELSFKLIADLGGGPITHVFSGRIGGDAISGTVMLSGASLEGRREWSATRAATRGAASGARLARAQ